MIFAGKRPTNLGIRNSGVVSCPGTPNCVSSQSQDAKHKIEPLTYSSMPAAVSANLKTVIQTMPRTKVIQERSDYLYAEFKSAIIGFVDYVEFYLDTQANVIHVRSASRLGNLI